MRICVAYDCLFPWTVGGAERWYRNLAERLAADGHDVTYATLRQWDKADPPSLPNVTVQAVGPRMALYTAGGRRRILPPLVYGAGLLVHLVRRGHRYDVVHMASFPYFSLLAAALVRRLHRYRLVADWHEVWTRAYWTEYLGRLGGFIGWLVQRLCARTRHHAFCFSRLHAARLREEGFRDAVDVLEGEYAGEARPREPQPADEVCVFAGRLIPEKRVPALVRAVAHARRTMPSLRAEILGDGPERAEIQRIIDELGLQDAVALHGFVSSDHVDATLARAMCMVLPSRREGYGMVVVEASARGTPSVVVADPDNAAVELVEDSVNGVVARSAEPDDLADAILRVHAAGPQLRASTADWFSRNARRLSLSSSLDRVAAAYAEHSL